MRFLQTYNSVGRKEVRRAVVSPLRIVSPFKTHAQQASKAASKLMVNRPFVFGLMRVFVAVDDDAPVAWLSMRTWIRMLCHASQLRTWLSFSTSAASAPCRGRLEGVILSFSAGEFCYCL